MAKLIKIFAPYLGLFITWYLVIIIFKIPHYILPNPLDVIKAIHDNYSKLISNTLVTLSESLWGFLIANAISVSIALIVAFNKEIENTVIPLAVTLKTIPIVAITPLLVLWFGPGENSKIATAALICFFPSLINTLRGVKSLDRDHVAFFRAYSANKIQLTKMLIIPSIFPYLFAALKVSSSLAIVGALVGEFVGANKGLGFLIITSYYTLNTPMVFACLIISSLMGIVFYYSIHLVEKKIVTWTSSID